jgi:hypothetical protein
MSKMAAGSSGEVVGGINLKEGENGSLGWVKFKAEMYSILFSGIVASDILCEFLEVAFHSILYVREVYPQGKPCRDYARQ